MFDLKKNCILCGKDVTKVKKSEVRTLTQELAQLKMLPYVLEEVRSIANHDLISQGAKYHRRCYAKYAKINAESVNASVQSPSPSNQFDTVSSAAVPSPTGIDTTPLESTCVLIDPAAEYIPAVDECLSNNYVPDVLQSCGVIETRLIDLPNIVINDDHMDADDMEINQDGCHDVDMNSDVEDGNTQCDVDNVVMDVDVNADTNASINLVCVDLPSDIEKRCACCRRVENEQINLNLKLCSGKFKRRRFGLYSWRAERLVLCYWCCNYLNGVVRSTSSQWRFAWAAAIASMLCKKEYEHIRKQLWDLLPESHRDSWSELATSVGLSCVLDEASVFIDVTVDVNKFDSLTNSGVIADFIFAMDGYAFPQVRCPAGCYAYLDECSCVQFNHFLAWKLNVVVFNGDAKYFAGARLDWPMSVLELDNFRVWPSIVADEQYGLSVMLCRRHGNGLQKSIIHCPTNPVLGNIGFQFPDPSAAAILTPNIVTAGKMGRWNNSNHVVLAVGGYSGISSSSIAPKYDRCHLSRRLSEASCLAMVHRPEVLSTYIQRYADSKHLTACLEYELDHYERYGKPTVEEESASLCGSTFVQLSDSFAVNDRMFKRGTEGNVGEIESYALSMIFVHPTDGFGSKPVDLSKYLNVCGSVTGLLLEMLVHCACVHEAVVRVFERSKDAFLRGLLSFVKCCAGQSRVKNGLFKNVKACDKATLAELANKQVTGNNEGECVGKFLALLCDDVYCCALSVDTTDIVGCCNVPAVANVVICYRANSARRWTDPILLENGEYHLMAVFCSNDEYFFRWSERMQFWHVQRSKKIAVSSHHDGGDHFECKNWMVLVYGKGRNMKAINDQVIMGLHGQHVMKCAVHNERFLVKQPMSCAVNCSIRGCARNARWLCQGGGDVFCGIGVCFSHGNDFLKEEEVEIIFDMVGRTLPTRPVAEEETFEEEFEHVSEDELDDRVVAPIGLAGMMDGDAPAPLHSREDMIPIYDVNQNMSSHYLWNQKYNVKKRSYGAASMARTNAIIEHIVAVTGNASVSLMYPEGQLFPNIFWPSIDDAVVGALPSFMLNCQSNSFLNIASVDEHLWVRMRDGCLLTSRQNNYWHYLFDVKLNTCLNHAPSRLIFKRGLEFLLESGDLSKKRVPVAERTSQEASLPMDESEATRRIKELACLLKKGPWHYFLTITCNDTFTPGVRVITRAIKEYAESLEDDDERELRDIFTAYLPITLRAWARFVSFFLEKLVILNYEILGRVKHLFYRYEFQEAGSLGNKPHVHCGITLHEEPVDVTVGRIACSTLLFHSKCYGADYETMHDLGIFENEKDYENWQEVVASVQHHDCSKAQMRCMKKTDADGKKICRYHRQPRVPVGVTAPWFDEIPMPYPEDVYQLLEEMDLARKVEDQWCVDKRMRAGKWHYFSRGDEFFLSSIPLVSAICQSSTNVDMCDRKFQVSYLIKYVTGKEEHQLVDVTGTKDKSEIRLTTDAHAHEKITSCRRATEKKINSSKSCMGREVSLAEVVWFVLGMRYTHCTADFVHTHTLPLENRVGILANGKPSKFVRDSETGVLNTVHLRIVANLPSWRCFTDAQIKHIEDFCNSPYIMDLTSGFNIRPPELLFFDDLQLYWECFVVVKSDKFVVMTDLASQRWYDGVSRLVQLRSCSIDKALGFVKRKAHQGNVAALQMLRCIFGPIAAGGDLSLRARFVKEVGTREVVSVVSFAKPWDRTKFLAHLCMSLGKYETETDVFCNGSIKEAFVRSGLLRSVDGVTRDDVLYILKRYVVKDLLFHPISARQFGRYLKAALATLNDLFTNDVLGDYSPCVLDVMLKEQAELALRKKEEDRKKSLVDALREDEAIAEDIPVLLGRQALSDGGRWKPSIYRAEGMSDEAFVEQQAALDLCVRAVDKYLNPSCKGVKFPCLVGRPGSGKSHVLKFAIAYTIYKGLSVELMSWTSERARVLGGSHLHLVFPLVVNNNRSQFSQDIVNACMKRLEADPMKKSMLKRTDVFVFEEIGLLSGEYFVALDAILRLLMGNNTPWGGKLLLSSGDAKQLPPINGTMMWASINMCTMMDVFVFKADVRARDPNLRLLNDMCRRELNIDECEAASAVILRECKFEEDWTMVPDVAVRIVATKAAEIKVTEEFLAGKQTNSYVALDEVQNGANWERAGVQVTKSLNKRCYEYDVCKLFVNAIVRMTYNERHAQHQFSQGQIAVVVGLPEVSDNIREGRLVLRLADPGVRLIDVNNIPTSWPRIEVRARTTPPVVVGRGLQMGRRTQYPVRFYICTTIHRIQGDTLSLVATQVTDSTREYKLWLKEQLAVLISRVRTCKDIIFVGNRDETKAAVERILASSSKWDAIVGHYMAALDVSIMQQHRARAVSNERHPFLPIYHELPSASCGFVCLIVSMVCPDRFHVFHASDLKVELRNINTGYGEQETRNTEFHPWGVYAFVCGFESVLDIQLGVANRADFSVDWCNASRMANNVESAYERGKVLADQWVQRGHKLTIVKCGRMEL